LVVVARVSELDTLRSMSVLGLGLSEAGLLVDVDVLTVLGTTKTLFFVDMDLFLDVCVVVLVLLLLLLLGSRRRR
jgi:hypothetical protein